jgi:hypothetical protein
MSRCGENPTDEVGGLLIPDLHAEHALAFKKLRIAATASTD